MIDTQLTASVLAGNGTTSPYPVNFPYDDPADLVVTKSLPGTGTVTVASGVATFSAAQPSLVIGSKVRVGTAPGSPVYEIATRASDTSFTFKTRPTASATAFHLPDSAVLLYPGTDYTIASDGVHLTSSLATNGVLTIFRDTRRLQLTDIPAAGPLNPQTIETALDRLTMQTQELAGRVYGSGIATPAPPLVPVLEDTKKFANNTERGSAVPSRTGQLGVQTDDKSLWVSTSTAAGQWTRAATAPLRTFADTATLLAAAPLFAGELATAIADSSVWVGTGTAATQWNLAWAAHPDVWDRQPWRHDEPVLPEATPRWAGAFPRNFIVERVFIYVAQVGSGSLTVRLHLPNTGRRVTTSDITLTNSASALVDTGGLTASVRGELSTLYRRWYPGIYADSFTSAGCDHLTVEIISAGVGQNVEVSSGSNISTLSSGTPGNVLTGTRFSSPTHGDNVFVIGHHLSGGVVLSHPSSQTSTLSALTARNFVIGVTGLALTAGATVVPASATELSFIRTGAPVTGVTVAPGTKVESIDTVGGTFKLNTPLTGATSVVTVMDPDRPPVHRFTGLSGTATQTTLTLPHTISVRVGDTLLGAGVATGTRVTAVNPTSITFTPALSGTVNEIYVHPPQRTASAAIGDTLLPLSSLSGIKVGQKVSGPGLSGEAWVTAIASPNIQISQPLSQNVTTALYTFTDDVTRHYVHAELYNNIFVLPCALADTTLAVGQYFTGPGIPLGARITAIDDTYITTNVEFQTSGEALPIDVQSSPEWRGLEVALVGHYLSYTPPR